MTEPHRHCADCGAILAPWEASDQKALEQLRAEITHCDPRLCEGCCPSDRIPFPPHQAPHVPPPAPAAPPPTALQTLMELASLRELEKIVRAAYARGNEGRAWPLLQPVFERLDELRRNTP